MRALLLCLLALALTGCVATPPDGVRSPGSVLLYDNVQQLQGRNYQQLNVIAGDVCRNNMQDPPATIAEARRNLQRRAAAVYADAVLIDYCQVVNGSPGCHQQAVCQGTALHFP